MAHDKYSLPKINKWNTQKNGALEKWHTLQKKKCLKVSCQAGSAELSDV